MHVDLCAFNFECRQVILHKTCRPAELVISRRLCNFDLTCPSQQLEGTRSKRLQFYLYERTPISLSATQVDALASCVTPWPCCHCQTIQFEIEIAVTLLVAKAHLSLPDPYERDVPCTAWKCPRLALPLRIAPMKRRSDLPLPLCTATETMTDRLLPVRGSTIRSVPRAHCLKDLTILHEC